MRKIIIILVILIIGSVDAKQMRIKDVEALLSRSEQVKPAPLTSAEQEAIKKRLDEQLNSPVESAWDERVNDLFDLAAVDPQLARSYFKKMSEKMVVTDVKPIEVVTEESVKEKGQKTTETTVVGESTKTSEQLSTEPIKSPEEKIAEEKPVELPVGEEPMKRSTKSAPPKKFGPKPQTGEVPKVESIEGVPSGEEPMKTSTRPAPPKRGGAPSGGPRKTLTPSSSAPSFAKSFGGGHGKATADKQKTATGSVEGGKKEVVHKKVEQIFSVPKLQVLDDDKLIELFNDLLDKLSTVPTNWNAMVVEKVEEKTKYGSKTYNVYGAPIAKWTNDINTLKKVVASKKIMSEAQVTQAIVDRIAQVRSEKKAQQVVSKESEEKPQEELTEENLVKLIKAQLADSKPTEIGWVVSVKGNIKALDKINHEEALKYHGQFIRITKEKPFLK